MINIIKDMRAPHGVLIHFDPAPHRSVGQVKERTRKTMACQHCGHQEKLPENGEIADVGDLCRGCWKFICPRCVKRGSCDPLEEQLRRWEAGEPINPYRLPK
jgi:hypothetical protein